MKRTCLLVLCMILLHMHIPYAYTTNTEEEQSNDGATRIVIHQKVNFIAENVDEIDEKVKDIDHDIRKANQKIKKLADDAQDTQDDVKDIQDDISDARRTTATIQKKARNIDKDLDNLNNIIENVIDQTEAGISTIGVIDSQVDVLQSLNESMFDKACNLVSLLDIIEDDTASLGDTVTTIFDNTTLILSFTEEIDSTTDIILSKACELASIVDVSNSILEVNLNLIISSLDDLGSQIDQIQTTEDSILDKMCDILTISEGISTDVDTLQSTADSIFDKTCTILTLVDDIDSESDVLLSITDIIESKVCSLTTCDNIITQADVGSGGVYTISLTGVYCLVENVDITAGAAITISGGPINVTLEFLNHTISGGGNNITTGVTVTGNANVVMRHGFIEGTSAGVSVMNNNAPVIIRDIKIRDAAPLAGAPGDSGGIVISASQDVTVEDCHCDNVSVAGYHVRAGSSHCNFLRCTAQNMRNAGFVVDNTSSCCIFEDCVAATNTSGTISTGFISAVFPAGSLAGGPAFGMFGIECLLMRCTSSNYTYRITGQTTNFGAFDIRGSHHSVYQCSSLGSIANVVGTSGFSISGNHHVIRDASAESNSGSGFSIGLSAPGFSLPAFACTILNCNANNNSINGFILNDVPGNIINLFRDNRALANIFHGFAIFGGSNNNKFLSNSSEGNNGFGFNNLSSVQTSNHFFNNQACYNLSGNYNGTIALVQEVTSITGFWVNSDCAGSANIGLYAQLILDIQASLNDFVSP